MGRGVERDEDGGREVRRKPGHELSERLDAARRGADHNEVTRGTHPRSMRTRPGVAPGGNEGSAALAVTPA